MVSDSIYTFEDESPFVEREESHEIYREIYGDPIYDVYEDDEIYREICGDPIYDTYGDDDVLNIDHIDFVFKHDGFRKTAQNPVHADLEQIFITSKKFDCKDGSRKIDLVPRTRLKIRGRIFEIYREICGDPIYDTYGDDDVLNIDHIDFVFKHDGFRKTAQNPVHADLEQIFIPSKKFDCKDGSRKIDLVPRTQLKIRGRIFLGRRDLMQRDIWNISKYLKYLYFLYLDK
ncbi:unnamed protein product [Microthlaspi erraticum]|uniref:Uncharacterized protein n=1 Tax=Microthlaspi erraticum TaxID=1685480 RepID=A0A6D2I752_9BRAS|nr:unnamed protein product [Microthlaspi erraticum]